MSTLIGGVAIAPAVDNLIAEIKSSAYSSWEVSIFCASDSLPFDGYKSILHVTSGSDYDQIGSRVFSFWRTYDNNTIFIGDPIGTTNLPLYVHPCIANTYSTYKIAVVPLPGDSATSGVELSIDDIGVIAVPANKVKWVNTIAICAI